MGPPLDSGDLTRKDKDQRLAELSRSDLRSAQCHDPASFKAGDRDVSSRMLSGKFEAARQVLVELASQEYERTISTNEPITANRDWLVNQQVDLMHVYDIDVVELS